MAFEAKNLKEEQQERDQINVSFNEEERKWLNEMKKVLDLPGDSTTLKSLALIGANTIRNQISADLMKFLVSKTRVRGEGKKATTSIYKRKSFTKIG